MKRRRFLAICGLAAFVATNSPEVTSSMLPDSLADKINSSRLAKRVFYGSRSEYHENIEIFGTADFREKTKKALEFIRNVDEAFYISVLTYLDSIEQSNTGTGVKMESKTFHVQEKTYGQKLARYASTLIHEAHHVELFSRGTAYFGEDAERACLARQNLFLEKAKQGLENIEGKIALRYWELPFEKRNW